jgi:hypothetical protein
MHGLVSDAPPCRPWVLSSGPGGYVGLEHDARSVRTWELAYVPGLLQTEDYARAILASAGRRIPDEVHRLLRVRPQRQQRLAAGPKAYELWAVTDEAAPLRSAGSSAPQARLVQSVGLQRQRRLRGSRLGPARPGRRSRHEGPRQGDASLHAY